MYFTHDPDRTDGACFCVIGASSNVSTSFSWSDDIVMDLVNSGIIFRQSSPISTLTDSKIKRR